MKEITKPRTARLTDQEFKEVTKNGKISFAKGVKKLYSENSMLKMKVEVFKLKNIK